MSKFMSHPNGAGMFASDLEVEDNLKNGWVIDDNQAWFDRKQAAKLPEQPKAEPAPRQGRKPKAE